jgi:hypothetical protein
MFQNILLKIKTLTIIILNSLHALRLADFVWKAVSGDVKVRPLTPAVVKNKAI